MRHFSLFLTRYLLKRFSVNRVNMSLLCSVAFDGHGDEVIAEAKRNRLSLKSSVGINA